MIIVDDLRSIGVLSVVCVVLLAIVWWVADGSRPLHASPAEHQATPDEPLSYETSSVVGFLNEHLRGNFRPGWIQHRKIIEAEILSVAA